MYNYNAYPYPSISPNYGQIGIPHVNGQNGAQAYQMPANSSVLLLDDNAPIVYLVKTDSACYKTITPYTISEYKPEPPVDMKSLSARIDEIERRLNESYSQSNEPTSKPTSRASQIFNADSSNGK